MEGPELILSEADRETQQDNAWTLAYPAYTILPGKSYVFRLGFISWSPTPYSPVFCVKVEDGVIEAFLETYAPVENEVWLEVTCYFELPSGWDTPGSVISAYKDPPAPDEDIYFNHASLKRVFEPTISKIQYLPIMGIG